MEFIKKSREDRDEWKLKTYSGTNRERKCTKHFRERNLSALHTAKIKQPQFNIQSEEDGANEKNKTIKVSR